MVTGFLEVGWSEICELILSFGCGPTNSEVNSTGETLFRLFNAGSIVKVEFVAG
jgi:hypothetical protein